MALRNWNLILTACQITGRVQTAEQQQTAHILEWSPWGSVQRAWVERRGRLEGYPGGRIHGLEGETSRPSQKPMKSSPRRTLLPAEPFKIGASPQGSY